MEVEKKYQFNGVKLTPSVFSGLLIQLFDGKQFTRQAAISTISEYHLLNGGVIEEGRNIVTVFKKATLCLQKKNVGLINKGYGTWELHYNEQETIEVVDHELSSDVIAYAADEVMGTGLNAVYVYYYDVYRKLAEVNGKTSWACKIGRTDCDPIQRVIGQAGTCYPELPHIALIIYCDDSSVLESAFHSILKYQSRWMQDAPGTEWFMTSPKEIKKLYSAIS